MNVQEILPRLEGVRSTGRDRWMAQCPAHEDRDPSLSLRQAEDRVLIHCFSGCPAADVLAAIGLSLADLYERPLEHARPGRKPFFTSIELVLALRREVNVVGVAAEGIGRGRILSKAEVDRVLQAAGRINTILGEFGHG